MDVQQIGIDFDVHKAIEAERQSFSETPNDVLRRLLKISKAPRNSARQESAGRSWSGKGVTLPDGTALKMEYNGVEHQGYIRDGQWDCGGKLHAGPSPAAAAVAVTRDGTKPSLNGWIYWAAKMPGSSSWVPISSLRNR